MYNLFSNVTRNRAASFTYPLFNYIREVLLKDVERWVEYRQMNPKAVRSDHLLVKTLQSINIKYEGNLEIYRSYVESRTAQFTGGLGYTSDKYKGKPFFGRTANFYGNKTVEIVIATDEDFSLKDAKETWRDWRPVRVLANPRSDITIESIDGSNQFDESGICVIEVNIPMLACQYQLWAETQQDKDTSPQMVGHFVLMYPLTNAVYSHLDVCLFNRMSRHLFNEKIGRSDRQVPFYVTDVTKRVDEVCEDLLTKFFKSHLPWEDVLRNIPSISKTDMLEVHRLPALVRNNQVLWAMIAARLNMTAFLVKLRNRTNDFRNVEEVTMIRRSLTVIESGKLLSNGLPPVLSTYFEKFITNRIEHYL